LVFLSGERPVLAGGRKSSQLPSGAQQSITTNDSVNRYCAFGADDLARGYRFDLGQDSELISPTIPI